MLLRWWRLPAYNADAMRVEARVEVEESGEPAKRRGGEPAQKVQDLHEPQQVRCGCVTVHWSLSHFRRHHGSRGSGATVLVALVGCRSRSSHLQRPADSASPSSFLLYVRGHFLILSLPAPSQHTHSVHSAHWPSRLFITHASRLHTSSAGLTPLRSLLQDEA